MFCHHLIENQGTKRKYLKSLFYNVYVIMRFARQVVVSFSEIDLFRHDFKEQIFCHHQLKPPKKRV